MTRCSILGIKEVVQFAFNNLASLASLHSVFNYSLILFMLGLLIK